VDVDTLKGNNVLLTDAGIVQEGERFPILQLDDYTDGLLGPAEFANVPFTVCLKNFNRFRFFVDVLGDDEN